jgi:hypothetical protein
VWIPQYASAGISSSPRKSFSMRIGVIGCPQTGRRSSPFCFSAAGISSCRPAKLATQSWIARRLYTTAPPLSRGESRAAGGAGSPRETPHGQEHGPGKSPPAFLTLPPAFCIVPISSIAPRY